MSHNSSWTLTQTGEARTWTLTQDGESRTFTIAPGVGPAGPAGPSNITTSTSTDITGILKGDGANVGAAVADTDYQSVPAEGAFADGDKTKLDGIESGADVTDATNVDAAGAVMESDYSPAHSVLAQQSGTGSPSAVTLGTNSILGRTTGAGTSITGLSASDVRTMLNVEDGATADQTASEILTAIKTVDGTGSGLDADLLDGQEASAFAAASHTHLSADITDATDDGSIPGDRGNLLKTDSSGQVKAFGVFGDLSIGGGFGLIDGDPDGSFTNYGIMVGNNITGGRTIELPDAEGTLALTSQTDGSIHAEDLDFAGSTDIGADLADADEILVSDGGGNTTRRKSALSRFWTYIKAKIESVALSTLEVTGDLTVDTNTLFVDASTDRVGVGIAAPAAKLHVSDATNATFKASSGTRSVNINSYASDWNYQQSLGAPFVFGTQDAQPLYLYTNNTQRLSISNAGSISTGSSSISLNGNPTISGNITASGQVELTGQSASTDDSAMTRSLGDARYGRAFAQMTDANKSFTSDTTLATLCSITLPEVGWYYVRAYTDADGTNTKAQITTVSGGATYTNTHAGYREYGNSGASPTRINNMSGTPAGYGIIAFEGAVNVFTAPAVLALQAAQNSSNATPTVFYRGSYIRAELVDTVTP